MKWLVLLIFVLTSCQRTTELSDGPFNIYNLAPPIDYFLFTRIDLDTDTINNGRPVTGKLYLLGDSIFKSIALTHRLNYSKTFYYYSDYESMSLKIGSGVDTVDFEMRVYEPDLSEGEFKVRHESVGITASFSNRTNSYDTTFILAYDITVTK
ncbi:MAG: hypothetical protein RIB71_07205 [Imperialibacter sp.]|uniref:hypothetical protein n=1 Tax=Imperialibacter sp. TaxID=2038411 RepID=UPI0032EB6C44